MRRSTITLALMFAATAAPLEAQYTYQGNVDLRAVTGAIGYGALTLTNLGSVADQASHGINARFDIHILSLLLHALPVRTYDAVYVDGSYGQRTSDSLPGLFAGDVQSTSGFQYTYGYQFLAGTNLSAVTVMGGLAKQAHYFLVAGTSLEGSSTAVVGRVELGGRRRIVVTGWTGISGDALVGGRVDLPLFRRLNLSASYWQADGLADIWSSAGGKVPARGRQLTIGVRSVEIR